MLEVTGFALYTCITEVKVVAHLLASPLHTGIQRFYRYAVARW